jgi:demethylmenaquinone methyltransferase/2-methoxy-6-polyprenyl-1,4-benzoquinol methylase
MPYRATFDCLWCGRKWETRGSSDLEGWAALCSDCVGRAQENSFLRFRLRQALLDRAAATTLKPVDPTPPNDDWYLHRGSFARGPVLDAAWHMELDQATQWLDALPLGGEIVELAAGTGWWSPLLAQKGELTAYERTGASLDLARQRLVAHGLRAHLHERGIWQEPDRSVDAVFAGCWLDQVPGERLIELLGLVGRWLRPGGLFAFVDAGRARTLGELRAALESADLVEVELSETPTYFVMGVARR